jgi:hypothetical protein
MCSDGQQSTPPHFNLRIPAPSAHLHIFHSLHAMTSAGPSAQAASEVSAQTHDLVGGPFAVVESDPGASPRLQPPFLSIHATFRRFYLYYPQPRRARCRGRRSILNRVLGGRSSQVGGLALSTPSPFTSLSDHAPKVSFSAFPTKRTFTPTRIFATPRRKASGSRTSSATMPARRRPF